MKIYEVMVFVNDSGYDVRCRNDIDSKPGFRRLRDDKGNFTGVIENEIFETGEIRYGYVVYSGPESKAKNFANLIKFGYKGVDMRRYFVYSSDFEKTRMKVGVSDLKANENLARVLERHNIVSITDRFQGVK